MMLARGDEGRGMGEKGGGDIVSEYRDVCMVTGSQDVLGGI